LGNFLKLYGFPIAILLSGGYNTYMRNNETRMIKISGHDVTVKKLDFRYYHFSAMVNGQYVSASHYSRYGVHKIREEIKKVS
jgi:hypothetical protein